MRRRRFLSLKVAELFGRMRRGTPRETLAEESSRQGFRPTMSSFFTLSGLVVGDKLFAGLQALFLPSLLQSF
jgi:hypothetical protein